MGALNILSRGIVGSKTVAMFGNFRLGGGVAPGGMGIMLSAGRVK